jgi:hypothetical protein
MSMLHNSCFSRNFKKNRLVNNILRIHKAAQLEGLAEKITLITNALSNKRNELKRLTKNEKNIGGQSILEKNHEQIVKSRDTNTESDKYLVETILFDDLVDYLPRPMNSNGRRQQAIMKMDIEGFEQFALSHASKMFNALDFCVIIMEWGKKKDRYSDEYLIDQLISFLTERGLKPYDGLVPLEKIDWNNWPSEIIWRKAGF